MVCCVFSVSLAVSRFPVNGASHYLNLGRFGHLYDMLMVSPVLTGSLAK